MDIFYKKLYDKLRYGNIETFIEVRNLLVKKDLNPIK